MVVFIRKAILLAAILFFASVSFAQDSNGIQALSQNNSAFPTTGFFAIPDAIDAPNSTLIPFAALLLIVIGLAALVLTKPKE
jgi:hypothetical protein